MSARTITEDMPEPGNIGPFIVSGTRLEIIMGDHLGDGIWHILPSAADYYWEEIVAIFAGYTVESLSDHDAEVRAEALELTDEEQQLATRVATGISNMATPNCILTAQLAAVARSREAKHHD